MVVKTRKISVIVTVYNHQQYLARCLESIVAQSYHNLEIILVDDGSTDGSLAICEKYRQKDSRIKLLHQANQGVAIASNRGLDVATGDYLCFVDDDDFVGEAYCQHLVEMALTGQADIAVGFFNIFNMQSKQYAFNLNILLDDLSFDGVYNSAKWLKLCSQEQAKLVPVPFVLWGKLYKRELFENVRCPINWAIGEDGAILWQLYLKAKRIAFKNYRDYVYSDHNPQSIHRQLDGDYSLMKSREQELAVMRVMAMPTKIVADDYQQELRQRQDLPYLQRLLKHYQQ